MRTSNKSSFQSSSRMPSISHMAIVVLGLFSNTIVGIEEAIALFIADGVISPVMFTLVGGVLYGRFILELFDTPRSNCIYACFCCSILRNNSI